MEHQSEEDIEQFSRLLEKLHQADEEKQCSSFLLVYVAPGAQNIAHLDSQTIIYQGGQDRPSQIKTISDEGRPETDDVHRKIRQCILQLMEEKLGEELLFNQQNHWQAIYRILVDKGYCRDSDFDGFDVFILKVMPDKVNKPYRKDSVKNISRTDFSRPFAQWRFDPDTSKTRKPFDRMVAVAQRFRQILEEKGL